MRTSPPKARLFLKLFVATAVPYGLVMGAGFGGLGALISFRQHPPAPPISAALFGIVLGMVGGVGFGAIMSAVLGGMHFAKTADPNVRHERALLIDLPVDEVSRLCIDAMRAIPGASIAEKSDDGSRIRAEKARSWRSWGDIVTCDVLESGPRRQVIVIRSRPQLATTLVDYGSNIDNVQAVVEYLLQRGASPTSGT